MTDNETIKALECCSSVDKFCTDCPLWGCERCIKKLTLYSFVFINRQKSEIDKLKAESEKHSDECLSCYAKGLYEGITEFAERLKEVYPLGNRDNINPAIHYDIYCELIDQVAEEMGVDG